MEKSCRTCDFFHLISGDTVGECRCHAPTTTYAGTTMYPIVNADMGCGDYSPKELKQEAVRSKRQLLKG